MASRSRYEVLDALRGVAAIGVMFFHLSILGLHIVIHGYLAVDFFFILSGFVLAHAYTDSYRTTSFKTFIRIRLIRIMPLSVFGLILGTSYFLLRHLNQNHSFYSTKDIVYGAFFNIFLLPKPWTSPAPTDTIFPSNTPLWSLSLEVFINFVWFCLLVRVKSFLLLLIVFSSGVVLSIFTIYYGNADIGATWPTYVGGISRVVFGFFMGILIWQHRVQPVTSTLYAFLSLTLLICVLMTPNVGPFFDVIAITFVLPAAVFIASCTNYRSERYAFRFLGYISYPLYAIHVPVFMFAAGFSKLIDRSQSNLYIAAISIVTCLIIACLLAYFYDRPARRIITGLFSSV